MKKEGKEYGITVYDQDQRDQSLKEGWEIVQNVYATSPERTGTEGNE